MMIAVVNSSTRVTDADVKRMVTAVAYQVRHHLCPSWNRMPVPVVFYADAHQVPDGCYVIGVADDSDQAGALGWHTEEGAKVFGRVFAGPVLDNGGDVLHSAMSVASVLSHEVLEALIDPGVNLWADAGNASVAVEVGDPVESDVYPVGRGKVTVSNFVCPKWFDPQAGPDDQFDWMGELSRPFSMTKGGYMVYRSEGTEKQVFGEHYPDWKRTGKLDRLARTARRVR